MAPFRRCVVRNCSLGLYTPSSLHRYLDDFDESFLKPTSHLDTRDAAIAISKNPIMSYRMIRRYSKMLENIKKGFSTKGDSKFLSRLMDEVPGSEISIPWPSMEELNAAMESLIKLHQVYEFNLDDFTSGNIMGTQTHVQLNSMHCQEIGEYAIQIKHYYSAIVWLEMALRMNEKSGGSTSVSEILMSLERATKAHDIAWGHRHELDYNFFNRRINETFNVEHRRTLRDVEYARTKGRKKISCPKNIINFWELCSGKIHQTEDEMSKLFCMYDSKSNPAWAINPLKVEQLSLSPFMTQFYDILGDKTIEALKEEAFPILYHSPVFRVSSVKVSRVATLGELRNTSEVVQLVNRRMELVTGLKQTETPLLIASYAFGGHFEPHADLVFVKNIATNKQKVVRGGKYSNDYLATFMINLENVEIGGYTAFPSIGIASKPIRGSAVFWYNTFRNGDTDMRTCHGGCPVVLGHKWTVNKRPYPHGQIFTRPCGLNRED